MAKFLDLDGVAYLWSKIKALIPTYLVHASETQEGIVNVGSQWFGGTKGANAFSAGEEGFRFFRDVTNASGNRKQMGRITMRTRDSQVSGKDIPSRMAFRINSFSSSTGEQTAGSDTYFLPEVAMDKTSNSQNDILTTKNLVTIAQGGTGASTAAAARTSLGLGVTTLYEGTFNSTAAAVTLTDAMNYSLLVFLGRPGDTINASLVVPTTGQISTSDVNYQIAGQSNYFSIKLKSSGNNVIMTYNATSNTSNGRITRVYGIR